MKTTLVASVLNVAECQKAKFSVSLTRSMTLGATGFFMSMMMPSPMHAPAAMSFSGKTVMSWQPLVAE